MNSSQLTLANGVVTLVYEWDFNFLGSCVGLFLLKKDDAYFIDILNQILESYDSLWNIKDKSGDLIVIKKELLKIRGLLQVLVNKTNDVTGSDMSELNSKASQYLDGYFFEREIDTMSLLYADDPDRLRNLRFKIIESLQDKKLIEKIKDMRDEFLQ